MFLRALERVRAAAAAAAAVFLAGACATGGIDGEPGPPAPAPTYHVGDRWVYHVEDGYRQRFSWDETHEIISIEPSLITIRVDIKGDTLNGQRIEKLSAPGIVLQGAVYEAETRRFDPALIRFQFPMAPGDRWNQRVRDLNREEEGNPYGPIVRAVSIGGWRKITTPAGTFDAILLAIIMTLDDETFWRYPTECQYRAWYAPAVGNIVSETKRSQWRDKGGQDASAYHPGQNATIELTSFTPGR
jgi:hypothetical protein